MITYIIFGTKKDFLWVSGFPHNLWWGSNSAKWDRINLGREQIIKAGLYKTEFQAESNEEAITLLKILGGLDEK